MHILSTDLYIDCYDLIKEANILYKEFKEKQLYKEDKENKEKQLYKEDINYIETMNKYINTYDKFKEKQIKQYIRDLQEYIQTY